MKKILLILFLAINSNSFAQFTSIGTFNLPDGNGVNYVDTITVSGLNAGALISPTAILDSLKVNIEHSYLGDLEMLLTCPNGDSVVIFNSSATGIIPGGFGGGSKYLGRAMDGNTGTPGVGEKYIWSSTSNTFGDFPIEFAGNNFIALTTPSSPSSGNSMNWNGIYAPEESFSSLSGCPINGDWVITIRDNFVIDDGYIFDWSLYFDTLYTPLPLSIIPTSSDASCSQCNGAASVNISGGNPPYTIAWNTIPIQTTQNIAGLCPGTYVVSVTEVNSGTILIDSVTITDNLPAPVIDSIITLSDNGSCNGAATAYITSSIPYTISWSPSFQTTNPVINLCDGAYCITVTDTNNCITNSCKTVNLVSTFLSSNTIDATCGQCNGIASVTVNNGNPPYTYSWTSNNNIISTPTLDTITNICSGTYFVSVIDFIGNTFTDTIVVNGTSAPIIDSISTTTDNGNCIGTATAYITSATPYSINWTPTLQTTNPAINLCEGQYCIIITDTNNCVSDTCANVNLITGLSELKSPVVSTYPNPIENELSISLETAASGLIRIQNSIGQIVFTKTFNNTNKIDIDIDLAKGTYFLQLEIDSQFITKKIIKK